MDQMVLNCISCSVVVEYPGFGRPRKYCDPCRRAAKKRGYDYEKYRAWYLRNRERVLQRERENRGRPVRDYDCLECGRPTRGYVDNRCETCRRRAVRHERTGVLPLSVARSCARCGAGFIPTERNQQRYCSVDCREIAHRKRRAIPKSLRRKVLQRDEWTCYLCGGAIPEWVDWPHQLAGTADHVIPWKHGGKATLDNLRAAHWHCNRRKADSLPEAA